MAIFRARADELTVRGEHGEYMIEPTRFGLDLTRCGMVAHHLKALVADGSHRAPGGALAPDIDVLLDAYLSCEFVEQYTA